jgi:hypothetical protein
MQDIYSKYHYEKVWRKTSLKDLERIISEELSDAPIAETLKYVIDSCAAGKTVSLIDVSFRDHA